jgi:hypothetical protein
MRQHRRQHMVMPAGIVGVSHLLHGLLTRFWDFITNMLISFGIDTCALL